MPRRTNNEANVATQRLMNLENSVEETLSQFPESVIRLHVELPSNPLKDNFRNEIFDMWKNNGKDLECCICLESIDCKRCCKILTCSHIFHTDCYHKLIDKKCPICRG